MTLNEVYVTKMSHDLAGIIGTLRNTAELAEIDADFMTEGLALLKNSAGVLAARLKFFRALLGLDTKIETPIATAYLETITATFHLNGAIENRLSLAFVLLATECLLRGGTITFLPNAVTFSGETVLLDSVKENILLSKEQVFNPQYMAALWISEWMKENNSVLHLDKTATQITFSFSAKE